MKEITKYGKTQREIRKSEKMSIRELAEKSGVSHSYLSQVENGTRSTPSEDIIKKIATALNYDYHTLAVVSGIINEEEAYIGDLREQLNQLQDGLQYNLNLLNQIEDIISNFSDKNEIPDDLIKSRKELEVNIEFYEANIEELNMKIDIILKEGMKSYELIISNENVTPPSQYVRFPMPKYEKITIEDKTTSRKISEEEAKRRFLSIENILNMDEDIYFNNTLLTSKDKSRALEMLNMMKRERQ